MVGDGHGDDRDRPDRDLPRVRLDDEREVGRREQEADPLGAASAGHRERRAEAVHRHEARAAGRRERRGSRRSAPGRAGSAPGRRRSSERNGSSGWIERPARYSAIARSSASAACSASRSASRVAGGARVGEQRAVRRLDRSGEAAVEVVEQDRRPAGTHREARSARAAARARARSRPPRPGSGCRAAGTASSAGMPITIASSGSSSVAPLNSIARRSASECAADGVPPSTVAADSSRGTRSMMRRRTSVGSSAERRGGASSAAIRSRLCSS